MNIPNSCRVWELYLDSLEKSPPALNLNEWVSTLNYTSLGLEVLHLSCGTGAAFAGWIHNCSRKTRAPNLPVWLFLRRQTGNSSPDLGTNRLLVFTQLRVSILHSTPSSSVILTLIWALLFLSANKGRQIFQEAEVQKWTHRQRIMTQNFLLSHRPEQKEKEDKLWKSLRSDTV